VEISGRAPARHFDAELKRGVDLALSLAAARLFHIALSGEERQSLGALTLVLKAAEARRALAAALGNTVPRLFLDRLSRQKRQALRSLIAKATARSEASLLFNLAIPAGASLSRGRRRSEIRCRRTSAGAARVDAANGTPLPKGPRRGF